MDAQIARRNYIDWARGIAVLLMIEAHTTDAWTRANAKQTVAFGFLVGVTGCRAGLEAEGGTEGVGRAATRGVVLSILLVMLADVLLVLITQAIP